MTESRTPITEASQKERIFAVIVAAGGVKDWPDLKNRLDFYIDPHNGKHLLYSLQKEGRISLHTEKQGSETNPVNIKPLRTAVQINLQPEYMVIPPTEFKTILTKEGLDEASAARGPGRPARVIHASGRHPIGKDGTDAKNHKPVAQGGPIERSRRLEEAADAVDRAIVAVRDAVDAIPPRQNEKSVLVPPTVAERIPERTLKTIYEVIDWGKFPLIDQLMHREAAVFRASKIMEEAGLVEQAIAIMETVTTTPFEKEVLALVKDLK